MQPAAAATSRLTFGVLTTLAVVLGVLMVLSPGKALAHSVSCGATVTADTRLHSDLRDCPGSGIVIGADNITVDLNGHTIDGDGELGCPETEVCDLGLDNTAGHSGVTIKNGSVRDFATGVFVAEASDNRLSRLALSNSLFGGLLVVSSAHTQIEHNTISRNGLTTDQAGLIVFDSHDLRIAGNSVTDNGDIGMFVIGSDDNRVVRNVVSRNPEAGMIFEGSRNEISRNRVSRNGDGIVVSGSANTIVDNDIARAVGCPDGCGYGISMEAGEDTLIARNVILHAQHDGIRIAAFDPAMPTINTIVRANWVRDAKIDAFSVATEGDGTVSATLLERNKASDSGDDGFDVRSAATVMTSNLAVRNADLGIEAVLGVTDGGGNRARANGNPQQCIGVAC